MKFGPKALPKVAVTSRVLEASRLPSTRPRAPVGSVGLEELLRQQVHEVVRGSHLRAERGANAMAARARRRRRDQDRRA